MRVRSVNVGKTATIGSGSRSVPSAFHKRPVAGPVELGREGLAGDAQGDPRVHGGARQAVYAYPYEHYPFWDSTLRSSQPLPFGAFGENLTVDGWLEEETRAGDRFEVGTAEVEVTKPRLPCFKMQIVFDRESILQEFLASGRTGFYLGVVRPGTIRAGDLVRRTRSAEGNPTIADLVRAAQRASVDAV